MIAQVKASWNRCTILIGVILMGAAFGLGAASELRATNFVQGPNHNVVHRETAHHRETAQTDFRAYLNC